MLLFTVPGREITVRRIKADSDAAVLYVRLFRQLLCFYFPHRTAEVSRKRKERRKNLKRYLLIGLATVGGGTVIGEAALGVLETCS